MLRREKWETSVLVCRQKLAGALAVWSVVCRYKQDLFQRGPYIPWSYLLTSSGVSLQTAESDRQEQNLQDGWRTSLVHQPDSALTMGLHGERLRWFYWLHTTHQNKSWLREHPASWPIFLWL